MNSFKRKELPKMADGKIVGIALVEIKEVKEINKNSQFLRVEANASTLNEAKKKIEINVFFNSYKVSVDSLIKMAKVNSYDELVGKLFYMKLSINPKGYQDISELFLNIEENELVYDPRVIEDTNHNILEDLF
ncbi:MAG: hypothetical protein KA336_05480 [Fusobacteriaceae bacterium]|nr:hypothetical protein [Leptotrichiaceae bacterium]MBP6323322.1 hypothetical protein [Fusobacteriaceae bacterium]